MNPLDATDLERQTARTRRDGPTCHAAITALLERWAEARIEECQCPICRAVRDWSHRPA